MLDRPVKLLSEEKARQILRPYNDRLLWAVSEGVSDFLRFKLSPDLTVGITPRTEASYANDKIIGRVREVFEGDFTVSVGKLYGLPMLNIRGKVVIRFKKLDRNCRSSNFDTTQQRLIRNGQPLPGLEDESRLIVGYRLDSLGIALSDVLVTCPKGRDVAWYYTLGSEAAPTLFTNANPIEPLPKPKVVPKSDAERKKAAQ